MPWPNADDMEPGDVISILGIDHVFYEEEMRSGGTPSWNNKNPGNIVHFHGEAEGYGAYPGKHNDIFAIFPSEETGFEAIRLFLRRRQDKTILEMMRLYAPEGHGPNNPEVYAARIAERLGVFVDTPVSTLDDDQLTGFAGRIQEIEGWRPGQVSGPDDLPEDVSQWLFDFPARAEREAADQPFAKVGTRAEGVKNIQRRLNELGWTPELGVDGVFGQGTDAAVKWFQSQNGLGPDGIVGNKTWRSLLGL
ncbi:peptidoglycan-binding protein [Sphaerisporangium perillae]|uniref:peptidoglycan-binding protein n=1 Tax=Sphaerisporangium perillae TaxID=2935860 RepID=UPI00200D4193|nr:peptidoglycan-binding protein [Sphaerisporangium perillae]